MEENPVQPAGAARPATVIPSALAEALGLPPDAGLAQLRAAMGLHQPPERLVAALLLHTDGLPVPRLPKWERDRVTSPHQLMFFSMSDADQQRVRELRASVGQPAPGWLEVLRRLQALYPDVPPLFNLEAVYHRRRNDPEAARAAAEDALDRFPGELFALCALAGHALAAGEPDRIPVLFEARMELDRYDPSGRVFDATEVAAFYGVMGWYHFTKQRFLRMAVCMAIVHAARPEDPFLDNLTTLLLQLPPGLLNDLSGMIHSAA